MDGYLVTAQVLLDLCADLADPNPAQVWSESIDISRLFVSVLSVAMVRANIEYHPDARQRQGFNSALDRLLAEIKAYSGAEPLVVDSDVAALWQPLFLDENIQSIPQVERQIYATPSPMTP